MKQRVMLAIALAGEPELLIADEPTTALDVTTQARMLELLKKLQRDMGMAMLFITHDLAVASRVSDRVAVMNEGRIVETGPTRQFFDQPQHPYSKNLLASLPDRPGKAHGKTAGTRRAHASGCPGWKCNFPRKRVSSALLPVTCAPWTGYHWNLKQGRTLAVVGEIRFRQDDPGQRHPATAETCSGDGLPGR